MAEGAVCILGTADGGGGAAYAQKAQPDDPGMSERLGDPGVCDGQSIPCDEKFSPPCLKCRTREDEAAGGAAGGLFAGRTVCVFCRGVRHGRFPCSRARLRRSVRFFHQGVGPEHSAPQAARAALWRSGEIRGSRRNRGSWPECGSCVPAGSGEGFGKAAPPRFWHEKRDGPTRSVPVSFFAAGPDYFQLSMLQCLTRSRSSAALPSLKRSRVPTR